MELRWPLLLPAAAVVFAAVAAGVWWLRRRRGATPPVALANVDVLTRLPEYGAALRAHRIRTAVAGITVLVAGAAALVGAARPVSTTVVTSERSNRDIVLCLDVSGSMSDADAEVVATFRSLARGFQGERLSLVIFNSSAVPVFPLTDDYDFVDEQLTEAYDAFESGDDQFLAGTFNGRGSSLIGDGLATCVRSFDRPDLTRARSVILATDNEVIGRPLFTLDEAGALASQNRIQVYGLNPEDGDPAGSQMRSVVEGTGGLYFGLDDLGAVDRIVQQITSREASRLPSTPQTVVFDTPALAIAVTGLGWLGFLISRRRWR